MKILKHFLLHFICINFLTAQIGTVENPSKIDLYWGDFESDEIVLLEAGSLSSKRIHSGEPVPRGLEIDKEEGKIFFIDGSGKNLKSMNLNGDSLKVLIGFSDPVNLELDRERKVIYVTDHGAKRITQTDYEGSTSFPVVFAQSNPMDIFLGANKIYRNDAFPDSTNFYSANKSGGDKKFLFQLPYNILNFFVDEVNEKFYFADRTNARIAVSDLDGSNVKFFAAADEKVSQVKIDYSNNEIYWAEPANGRIRVANLDGSNIRTIVSGLAGVSGIGFETYSTSTTKNSIKTIPKVYPNPAKDFLFFEANSERELLFFNSNGKMVLNQKTSIGTNQIPIQKLASGTYFIIQKRGNNTSIFKLIKS